MNKILPLFASLSLIAIASCGKDGGVVREAWNPINDPLRLENAYQRSLSRLPTQGQLTTKPWSDSYWPTQDGGIAQRWFRPDGTSSFTYATHSEARLRQMSIEELRRLSPAEKYDIVNGRFDYPTVQDERRRTNPNAASWEGLCHGWAPAAVNFSEPQPIVVDGPNGLKIPFGSSDIKALLTLYQGNLAQAPAKLLGARCNVDLARSPGARNNPECRDTNAGSFHVVLTNQIGLMKKSFIADVTQDYEVWNQPVHAFTTRVVGYQSPSAGAAPGTVREAVVQTTMRYTVEVAPNYYALLGTNGHADTQKTYQYRLELNANDEIIGGEWISDDRPDFVWTQERPVFRGYWQKLEAIYTQSIGGQNPGPQPTVAPTALPTAFPTVQPTFGPSPRPTVRPTVIPTARPTVAPTVRPTIVPQPQPTQPPVGNPGQYVCQQGLELQEFDVAQGKKGYVCVGNSVVQQGSVTNSMMQFCASEQGWSQCSSDKWDLVKYQTYRGNGACPAGSIVDKETRLCKEGAYVVGPFEQSFVQACLAALQGSSECYAANIKHDFAVQLLQGTSDGKGKGNGKSKGK